MVKVEQDQDGSFRVSHTGKLYCIDCSGVVVIAPMRPKTAQVSFWTEEEYAKAIEQCKKKAARELKRQAKLASKNSKPMELEK